MKNVLLTTTALIAFAGAAATDAELSLSGSASATYNVATSATVLAASATVGASFSTELNNGMVATLSVGDVLTYTTVAADDVVTDVWETGGSAFTATLVTYYGTLSFGDVAGAGYDGDGDSTMSLPDGMSEGVAAEDESNDVRIEGDMGGFTAVLSFDSGDVSNNSIAVSGTAAGADIAFATDGTSSAMTAALSMGGIGVDVAYATDGTDNSVGVAFSYSVTSEVTVSGSAATNSAADNEQAVSIAYASGALTASLDFDVDASTYEVESTYTTTVDAIEVALTMGYNGSDVSLAVDATYTAGDLGGGASAFATFANANELGPNEIDDGTFVGISLEF